MNVFIEEIGSNNKGAYLMFLAIIEKLNSKIKNIRIVVDDKQFTTVEEAKHNLYKFVNFQRFKIKIHDFIDSDQLAKYHLMKFRDIDLVLNAGGYANGDFWYENFGKKDFIKKIDRYKRFKKNGVPIILLPQAFDTFTSDFIKSYIIELHNTVDLIYARDQVSLDNLQNVLGKSEKVKLSPDFTNLIEVAPTQLVAGDYVTIIPNSKMIQAGIISRNDYVENLLVIAKTINGKGFKVVFLNHEGKDDEALIEEVREKIDFENVVLTNLNALEVKSVIRDSLLLITGRFHGLVSALSQGTPVLSTSWSHKYSELLSDYNVEGQLLDINNKTEIINVLSKNLQSENMRDLRDLLEINSIVQKSNAEKMWKEVFQKVENH